MVSWGKAGLEFGSPAVQSIVAQSFMFYLQGPHLVRSGGGGEGGSGCACRWGRGWG